MAHFGTHFGTVIFRSASFFRMVFFSLFDFYAFSDGQIICARNIWSYFSFLVIIIALFVFSLFAVQ